MPATTSAKKHQAGLEVSFRLNNLNTMALFLAYFLPSSIYPSIHPSIHQQQQQQQHSTTFSTTSNKHKYGKFSMHFVTHQRSYEDRWDNSVSSETINT